MKKIILTIGFLMGFASFVSAQRGNAQPVEPSNKTQQTQQTNTVKPQRANKHTNLPAQSEIKNKHVAHQMDNATNRELMRSEEKSTEKLRKEVIK